jgi:2-polyprenyl-3-methyl-5-hydroxy-6-metoxy-1,4-benzoquinol methylase
VTEHKLFEGDSSYVSTFEFHEHRERAPHLEQESHTARLLRAAEYVRYAATGLDSVSVSDLGCGDGGLLSLIRDLDSWGYDFAPANVAGWRERGVRATSQNAFEDLSKCKLGNIVVMTEVLEHVLDPHGALRYLYENPVPQYLICSSPWNETPEVHCPEHAWAWDVEGFTALIEEAGWRLASHELIGSTQLVLAKR